MTHRAHAMLGLDIYPTNAWTTRATTRNPLSPTRKATLNVIYGNIQAISLPEIPGCINRKGGKNWCYLAVLDGNIYILRLERAIKFILIATRWYGRVSTNETQSTCYFPNIVFPRALAIEDRHQFGLPPQTALQPDRHPASPTAWVWIFVRVHLNPYLLSL